MLVKFEEEEKKKKESVPSIKPIQETDIDELSILAGKQEAKLESEKFEPTEEQLLELERRLKEINENKFKNLEEPSVVENETEENDSDEEQLDVPNSEELQQNENEPTIKRLTYINRNG
jgi:hypothetical protein